MSSTNKSRIYSAILQDIVKGEYQSGVVLSERRLMEKYGVSKSPVREALVELCNENVLRSIPRYGYELISLTEKDVYDVLQFRTMVECRCLRLGVKNMTPGELNELERFAREDCPYYGNDDIWESWESNSRFHLRLLSYSGNRYCHEQVARSLGLLKRAYAQFYWDKWKHITFVFGNGEHLRIVEALARKDLEGAERILEKDINSFGKSMEAI